jgi:hypothetical protein
MAVHLLADQAVPISPVNLNVYFHPANANEVRGE